MFDSHLEFISGACCFLQELTFDEFLISVSHALFSGCWIFTDSDLLTRINMVKNGGFYRTERLLTHNAIVIGLIFFFLAGRLCCAANLILPLVSRWEVTKLTSFLQNFLGFCCFECRIWSLVRCSLNTFFGSEGGRPRRSNDEFALEESASLFQSAGWIGKKTRDREIWLQIK